jgi:hypothetical protein
MDPPNQTPQGAVSVLVAIMPESASDFPAMGQAWHWMIEWFSLVVCVTRAHAPGVVTTLLSSPVGFETLVAHAVPYPRMHFVFPFAANATPLLSLPNDLQVAGSLDRTHQHRACRSPALTWGRLKWLLL